MGKSRLMALIAAILLPPLAIYLARGLGREFWIGTALTLLFWIPGIVFALISVLRPGLIVRHQT